MKYYYEPQKLSPVQEVRKRSNRSAEHRRNIALLSTIGLLDFIPISLYQLGLIKHLPELPGNIFDSDYVNASEEAQVAGVPDGPLSLVIYAANLVLVAGALKRRKKEMCLII